MSRSGNVAGVLLLALAAGACAGPNSQPVGQPALGFATEATPVPGKYQAVPTCAQIGQRVPGLPKFRSGNEARSPFSDLHTGCEFQKIPDYPRIGLGISVWLGGAGRTKARERFDVSSGPVDDGAADVGVGDQAKWQSDVDHDNCYLVILDANAVLVLRNKPSDRMNPKSEECRSRLKELAPVFFAAVQSG